MKIIKVYTTGITSTYSKEKLDNLFRVKKVEFRLIDGSDIYFEAEFYKNEKEKSYFKFSQCEWSRLTKHFPKYKEMFTLVKKNVG